MTTKVQRDWEAVCDELNAKLRKLDHDYISLSKAAGISYHAARRFILGGAKNRTTTAVKLCEHFGIAPSETAKPQSNGLDELTALVEKVWDGTEPHAELLAKLIKSTEHFKVQGRLE